MARSTVSSGSRPVVPLQDLKRSTHALSRELHEAIEEVFSSGWFVLGPQVAKFETAFAGFCGVRHCVSVANGTDALEIALSALGCGPGDHVVTVANAGMYGSAAAISLGARPVFCDIDPVTMTMDAASLRGCLDANTRAIIVTHLYGRLADMEALSEVARQHGVPIIEDCAQAHGAERRGRKAGSFGAVGCYSFYPTKNLGALGDGGALVTNDEGVAMTARSLRQYGWKEKYVAATPRGRNSRLDEIQAAVLLAKLPYVNRWNARRRDIIAEYRNAAGNSLNLPAAGGDADVAHLCVARSPHRDHLRSFLKERGIATDIHYPVPDHCQPALQPFIAPGLALPVTEEAAAQILTIPCFPEMTDEEVEWVSDGLSHFAGEVY